MFALEYADQGEQLQRVYFFLEADRGTMPVGGSHSVVQAASRHRAAPAPEFSRVRTAVPVGSPPKEVLMASGETFQKNQRKN
jgi:hypothetical protein